MIKRLKDNYTGKFIISIILGLGIAALFRKVCNNNKCIVIKAPKGMKDYYQEKGKIC